MLIAGQILPMAIRSLPSTATLDLGRLLSHLMNRNRNMNNSNKLDDSKTEYKAFVSLGGDLVVDGVPHWSSLIGLAAHCLEQNLIIHSLPGRSMALLSEGGVVYMEGMLLETCRPVAEGAELRAWFSPTVAAQLGIPLALSPASHLLPHERAYACGSCGQKFIDPNPLRLHIGLGLCGREAAVAAMAAHRADHDRSLPTSPLINVSDRDESMSPSSESSSRPLPSNNNNGNELPAAAQLMAGHFMSSNGRIRKTHTCMYCGKLYTRKYGLKIHLRTHTGLKPLRCKYCGRPFSDPSNLNKHIRLHQTTRSAGMDPHHHHHHLHTLPVPAIHTQNHHHHHHQHVDRTSGDGGGGDVARSPESNGSSSREHVPNGNVSSFPVDLVVASSPTTTSYQCKLCEKVLVRRRDLERHMRSRHQQVNGNL